TVTQIRLSVDRSVMGQAELRMNQSVAWSVRGGKARSWRDPILATGRSPLAARPVARAGSDPTVGAHTPLPTSENARANQVLRGRPGFQKRVSVRPEPSCPPWVEWKGARPEPPGAFSADVWEAVHRATGQSIVADFYSHLYPVQAVTVSDAPLFDA